MSGSATYVYCVVHRAARPPATRMPSGIPGGSTPVIDAIARGLWLVSARVPLAEYAEREIERRLQDLDWVSTIALAHEAVVERFSRTTGATVIPMKLFTIFSSPARSLEEMRRRRPQLESVAKRIRGAEEWGVRIARRSDGASAPAASGSSDSAASGTAFLTAKRRARDEAHARIAAALEAAEHAFVVLRRFARETRRQDAPAGAATPPLLDAALLVPSSRKMRFKAAANREARRCREAGADLMLTGPWPAYNFIQTPDGVQ